MDNDDGIVQVLTDHEHVIDCIVWAPTEAYRTIDNANYSGPADDVTEEINGEAEQANDSSIPTDS